MQAPVLVDTTYSDAQLLSLMASDNADAFAIIYDRYSPQMMQRAKALLHSPETASDIVQDVFLSIWQRRHVLEIDALGPYLMQSTRFRVFKSIQEGKARREVFQELAYHSAEVLLSDPLLLKELKHIVDEVLASLPEDQRAIFLMHRNEAKTYGQIADEMGISVKTVEKKISRTLQTLRNQTGDYLFPILIISMPLMAEFID